MVAVMNAAPATCASMLVSGRVHGVGFRWFVRRHAEALGLRGWARNRREGTVELEVCGPRAAIERLLDELRQGPPAAEVGDVQVHWLPPPTHGSPAGFEIRPTA